MKLKSATVLLTGIACALLLLIPGLSRLSAQSAPTSQCKLIDGLIILDLATPVASPAATESSLSLATMQSTIAPTIVRPTATLAEAGAAEAGGGDEALTTYNDTVRKISIGYPRSWSQETTFKTGVCFTGRDASIAVQFVTGAAPADLLTYVKADEANVQAKSSGYKQVYLKPSTDVRGAVILGYEWDAGKSTVTEKPVHARFTGSGQVVSDD